MELLEDGDEDEDMEGARAGDVHQGDDSHSCPSTTCLVVVLSIEFLNVSSNPQKNAEDETILEELICFQVVSRFFSG